MMSQHIDCDESAYFKPRPYSATMASSSQSIIAVDHVTMELPSGEKLSDCTVRLSQSDISCIKGGTCELTIPLTRMKSIQIHQPIFGANYISGEYIEQGIDNSFTMTFKKGGATDFARAFFRTTEGRLVTDEQETTPTSSEPHPSDSEDKKNR